jgi:thioredoxin
MSETENVYEVEIDPADFQQRLSQGERLLISFGATWCGPCKQMLPTLRKLGSSLSGQIRVGRIETDLHPELGTRFQIRAYPTLVLFDAGVERGRVVGLQSASQLKSWIEKSLPAGQPLEALSMTRPDWGAFYGNDFLRKSLVDELLRLAADGKVGQRMFPDWEGGAGSPSAALVKHENPAIFERVTGMPLSFAMVLELAEEYSATGIGDIFAALPAGADVTEILPRLLIGWLADEDEHWSTHVADTALDALRLRWVELMRARFAGEHVPAEDWTSLRDAVRPWADGNKEHEISWHLGRFIRAMSPPLALDAQASALLPLQRGVQLLRYYLTMLQAGATPEILNVSDLVHQWFSSRWPVEVWQTLSKEEQSAERAKMYADLKVELDAKAIVDEAAKATRAATIARFRSCLIRLLKACPRIAN